MILIKYKYLIGNGICERGVSVLSSLAKFHFEHILPVINLGWMNNKVVCS